MILRSLALLSPAPGNGPELTYRMPISSGSISSPASTTEGMSGMLIEACPAPLNSRPLPPTPPTPRDKYSCWCHPS